MRRVSACLPSSSGPGQRGVDGLLPAGGGGAVGRGHGQAVEDGAAVGPPGGVEVRVLVEARGVAGVRVVVVGALDVSIVTLGAGERRRGRGSRGGGGDAGLAAVGAVVGVRRRPVRVLAVVAGAQLLRLDVEPVLVHLTGGGRGRGGGGGHGALAAPRGPVGGGVAVRGAVGAGGRRRLAVAVL